MNDTMPTTGKRFARAASSVPAARAFAREVLREAYADGLDDVLLCVSELATNTVRHGVPVGGAFLLKVGADERCVRVECHDAGRRLPRVRHPGHDEQGGRGLLLVDAVGRQGAAVRQVRVVRAGRRTERGHPARPAGRRGSGEGRCGRCAS